MKDLRIPLAGLMFAVMALAIQPKDACAQKRQDYTRARHQMTRMAVQGAGIKNERVVKAIRNTPRHEFMPKNVRNLAYYDLGVPIGFKQTISSPFIVAFMTESIDPQPTDKVLEIGTGSGYQAAVLSPLVDEVYSIEIVPQLGKRAATALKKLKYENVFTKIGDGFQGWEEHAPFDKIIVTCSPEDIPQPLIDQLADGGLMVIPVGERFQQSLVLMRKSGDKVETESLRPTLFVPMTGLAEDDRDVKPDPANPQLLNHDFEQELGEDGFVKGWYYQRQMTREEDDLSPSGSHYVKFTNREPGRHAHLMQGFAIDGRKVSELKISASFKSEDVRPGPSDTDFAMVACSFYNADRVMLSTAFIGPFQGTRNWSNFTKGAPVPKDTREAILRIGLMGATGTASFDSVTVKKTN